MNLFSFILSLKSIFFFMVLWFQDDGISITHNIPSKANPGGQVPIEIKIRKGNISGFAKFNLDLPEGITVKENENAGSSFSQQGNIAKWIWTVLPNSEELVIKCTLIFSQSLQGQKSIGGRFSYILNNEKTIREMEAVNVQVGEGTDFAGQASAQNTTNITNQDSNNVKQNDGEGSLSNAQTFAEPISNPEVTRKVEKISASEYRIYITIKKGKNISGFAKFSDNLPENFNARALETDGASFSIADYRVKFVWVNVPEKEILNISYVLNGTPSEQDYLQGEWVYLDNDQSKKVTLTRWNWKDAPESLALSQKTVEPVSNNENNTPNQENNQSNQNPTLTPVQNQNEAAHQNTPQVTYESNENKNQIINKENTTEKASGVVYRVQVGAFRSPSLSPSRFAQIRYLGQTPQTEMSEGYTKYILGKFSEYKQARDKRESVRSTVPSAFVVAYNGPTRITVQEALMLSHQVWLK